MEDFRDSYIFTFGFLMSNEFDTRIEILNIFEGLKNFPFEFGSLSAALKNKTYIKLIKLYHFLFIGKF